MDSWIQKKPGIGAGILLMWALTASVVVHAVSIRVSPIRVYLSASNKISSVTIFNESNDKVIIQVSAKSWSQDEQGRDQFAKTRGLIFFPKILTLEKGQQQLVRISLKGPPAISREKTYRLYIRELPVASPGETAIKFTLQISLPVFIQPLKELRQWSVEKLQLDKGQAQVHVLNSGNGHILVNNVTVTGWDSDGTELFTKKKSGWYVLSGISKSFLVPLPPSECLRVTRFKVTVESNDKIKEKEVLMNPDSSQCSPPAKERNEKKQKRQ